MIGVHNSEEAPKNTWWGRRKNWKMPSTRETKSQFTTVSPLFHQHKIELSSSRTNIDVNDGAHFM